jgi:uncharacterized protein YceH (UPF0502 family)
MADFDDVAAVESDLAGLTRRDPPLVARLPRRPGQKEERWTQLLMDVDDLDGDRPAPVAADPGGSAELDALRSEVDDLAGQIQALREEVRELKRELGA